MLLKLAKLQKPPKKGWKSCKSHHKKVGKIARNCYHRDRKVAKCSMWDDFMLKRSAKKYIDSWIQSGRDALLIMGARQIGKTYLIKECLRESVVPYVELK